MPGGCNSWDLALARCAARTREELLEYRPRRPLGFDDELQVRWMKRRCETCGACPLVLKALDIMLPAPTDAPTAQIIKLAG